MNNKDINLREYLPGDETGIVRLHREVFNSVRTVSHWHWQFKTNAQGDGWITLAESNREIVAQYCMMRNHLNYMGDEILASQSCDTMVRSDQRGKKLFTRLAEHSYRTAKKQGLVAVIGFPNRNSYPGFVRSLQWNRLFNLNYYYFRVGLKHTLGRSIDKIYKNLSSMLVRLKFISTRFHGEDVEISVSYRLPGDIEDCLNEARNFEVLSIWKDLKYLQWRYQDHPEHRYLFHILKKNNRTDGIVVTRNLGERVAFCDVIHRTKNVVQTAMLIYQALLHYQHFDVQVFDFYGFDNGFFDTLLQTCGFHKWSISNFTFGGRVFHGERLAKDFVLPHNWTIVYGDTDLV